MWVLLRALDASTAIEAATIFAPKHHREWIWFTTCYMRLPLTTLPVDVASPSVWCPKISALATLTVSYYSQLNTPSRACRSASICSLRTIERPKDRGGGSGHLELPQGALQGAFRHFSSCLERGIVFKVSRGVWNMTVWVYKGASNRTLWPAFCNRLLWNLGFCSTHPGCACVNTHKNMCMCVCARMCWGRERSGG